MSLCLSFLVTIVGAADDFKYTAKVLKIDNNPVVSFIDGTSDFRQVAISMLQILRLIVLGLGF